MYILQNKSMKAEICADPLELSSLTRFEKEYVYQKEGPWKKSWPMCFPWTGKLLNDEYQYDNKTYKMGGHGVFRLIKDWNVVKYNETELKVSYSSEHHFYDVYPFMFTLEITYKISETGKFINKIKITNDDNKVMPYGFGWHPAFICDDYFGKILFDSNQDLYELPLDTYLTDNMPQQSVNHFNLIDYPFEHSNCYFVMHNTTKTMMIVDPDRVVRVKTDGYKGVMIWKCADNARYICLEPWASHQDAKETASLPLDKKPGVNFLQPGESTEYTLEIDLIK